MAGCSLEACLRFTADTEVECSGKEKRSLEKGDREGHGQKTGRSAILGDEGKKKKIIMFMMEEEEEKEAAMNTNLAKNDAIFYTISHGIISMVTTFA
jgi:hypothetical protein